MSSQNELKEPEDTYISERCFRLIALAEPWNGLPQESSPKAESFVLFLWHLLCPFSLQNCCIEQKVTSQLVGCVDSGMVFCNENNILFSPLPKEFCCSNRCAGTNTFQLVQALFDLCIFAFFCKTNVKMKKS